MKRMRMKKGWLVKGGRWRGKGGGGVMKERVGERIG